MALSGDTIVVAAPGDDAPDIDTGSSYIFQHGRSGWTEMAQLTASDGAAGDLLGFTVDIDGNTVVLCAPFDDDLGSSSGSAYIFQRHGSTWTEQAKLIASDGAAGGPIRPGRGH